jgi:hypothetical protein
MTIRWPSGRTQRLTDLAADRHIVVDEESEVVQTVTPGQSLAP